MARKPPFGQYFDDFGAKYLQIVAFFWEIGFFQIEGHI